MNSRKRPLSNPKALKEFGKRVKQLRLEKGISQEQLADDAGIERSYMGAIERGERNPSLDKVTSIAFALKVKSADLLR